jgi:hypothetical protein
MDESIFGNFKVLDIQQHTPMSDVSYVHILCVIVSQPLGFWKCWIWILGLGHLRLGFKARMLDPKTRRILLSTIFLYTFAHLMMMHLICALYKFAFTFLCFVLGLFWCLAFTCSLVLVPSTCWQTTIRHALCEFAFVFLCFVISFFQCLTFTCSLVLLASTC